MSDPISLSSLFRTRRDLVDPRLHSSEVFYSYSLPAFDATQQPETVRGAQIDSAKFIVDPGTLLISKLNPRIKRVWRVENDGRHRSICSTEFVNIVPSDPEDIDFLFQLLGSDRIYRPLQRIAEGTTNSHVRFKPGFLQSIKLPDMPERPTWGKIAAGLKSLDEVIKATEKLVEKHQQIKAGLMHDLFTRGLWTRAELARGDHHGLPCEATAQAGQLRPPPEEARGLYQDSPLGLVPREWSFGRLSDYLSGRPKNGFSPQEVSEWSGLLALGLGCLTREGFSPHHLKMVGVGSIACNDALLADGDLLISRSNTRELVGLCGIYRDVGFPCIYPDLMMRIRPNGRTSARYLEELLLSPLMRNQITGAAVGTSGSMVKLNSRSVLGLELAVPGTSEQEAILSVIKLQRASIETQSSHLAKLRQQKQGLMHDLLTGRVRVA